MKRKLQLIALSFVATFLFANLSFAQFAMQKDIKITSSGTEKTEDGQWVFWHDEEPANAIGLTNGGDLTVAAVFDPADLPEGPSMITHIEIGVNDVASPAVIKIWQGELDAFDLLYSQTFDAVEDEIVIVELTSPVVIDYSQRLIIGWTATHEAGDFPSALDVATNANNKGNLILNAGVFVNLTDLAPTLVGDWIVSALVVEMEEQYTVVDIIVGSDDHTTLATAVTLAGLVEALSGEGPFTVFAPTDDAFDALPDGLLDALLADPAGDLTNVLLYHVVAGNVMSGDLSDGQVITTLLGQELTVTIDGGVFINDVSGNSVQVTVPDLEADNGVVHVVDGVLIPDLTVQSFSVTFNVDMNEVEGFDPDVHDVYIAGSFPGDLEWNEPGSNDDLKLTLVGPAKDGEVVVILEEGFEGAGFPPVGWNNVDGNEDGNAWFRYTADDSANSGDASAASASWFGGTVLFPDNWLITPQLAIPNDTYMLEYYVGAQDPAWAEETYGIYISTTGADPDDFGDEIFGETMEDGDWHFREVSLADYAGEEIYIAFRHYNSSDWFYIKIDDVMVYGVAGDEPPVEDYIYTITLDLEEGDVQYKYFSTVIADGWAGGEWEGDPNRVITVDADMTVDDVFGDQPVSVVENELAEQGINLFPNPVRNTLYVENSDLINDLRIFDLTGRIIFSQVVNDNATSINVSEFKTGVYIMQVMTVNGVVSKRFSVQ